MKDHEKEDEAVERGHKELGRIAAKYLADVIAAIEGSPAAEQRRPVMLGLKVAVSFTAAVVDLADLLPSFLPEDDEPCEHDWLRPGPESTTEHCQKCGDVQQWSGTDA